MTDELEVHPRWHLDAIGLALMFLAGPHVPVLVLIAPMLLVAGVLPLVGAVSRRG